MLEWRLYEKIKKYKEQANMSRNEKLLSRILSFPSDFTWDELIRVLSIFNYKELNCGKTGGSRRKFADDRNNIISLHKPHPSNRVKDYAIRQVVADLRKHKHIIDE